MCCPSVDCKTWICKVCYDSYDDDDDEVHHVEVMNEAVAEEYMDVVSEYQSTISCNDSEEESDGSDESIVNEYEGGECDNDVLGDIDDMEIFIVYRSIRFSIE